MAPKYIVDYTPKRQKRSSSNNLLVTQKSNLKSYGDKAFRVAAPRLWNALRNSIRLIQSLSIFKNKLKPFFLKKHFISYILYFLEIV